MIFIQTKEKGIHFSNYFSDLDFQYSDLTENASWLKWLWVTVAWCQRFFYIKYIVINFTVLA